MMLRKILSTIVTVSAAFTAQVSTPSATEAEAMRAVAERDTRYQ